MALPGLLNWEHTRDALHQIAQVVGAVRSACSNPLPNDLHYSLDLTATGFSSTTMRCGGVLDFNFYTLRLSFCRCGRTVFSLDVRGHSQVTLARKLLATFADCGYSIAPSMKHITQDRTLKIDPSQAMDSLHALNALYRALARFRAKLAGFMTPLVLWPHHFDTAFLWFPTDQTGEHSAPQIAFGFSPFSPGLARPYIYAYAWSKPTGYLDMQLDPPARAITEGYTGLYAAYDDLKGVADFDSIIESLLLRYHSLAAAKLV
ncbi:MAG: DUF5996 family protein [Chloroflexi bacterium]|nr:DUF5996 family protein [Chloroflexota bacterium]